MTAADAHRIIMDLEGGGKLIKDEGGLTKWGISQRAYPQEDIANMTQARSLVLFTRDYWAMVKGDQLPEPLNLIVVDAAFNQGVKAAIMMLQRALGNVAVDGILGRQTLGNAHGEDVLELSARMFTQRHKRYIGTRNFDKNADGWFNRLGRLTMKMSRWSNFSWD